MGKLDGKVAIVTGASRGIGAAIATLFAAEGAKVVCAARTVSEGDHPLEGSLQTTVNSIYKAGGEATAIACNISEESDCRHLIEQTKSTYGPVDILVNNAALTYFIPIAEMPPSRWLRSFGVNVHGAFFLSHYALPDMIARKSGAIINISSGAAIGPGRGPYTEAGRGGTLYGAEKAALERFTQGLAQEVFEHNISVTCFSPSQVVPTPGTVFHHLVDGMDDPRGEPPEYMARTALLLATLPVKEITGRVTYTQQIMKEYGLIDNAKGAGVERRGSGYSEI